MKIEEVRVARVAARVSNELSTFCGNRCLVKPVDNKFTAELISPTSGWSFGLHWELNGELSASYNAAAASLAAAALPAYHFSYSSTGTTRILAFML